MRKAKRRLCRYAFVALIGSAVHVATLRDIAKAEETGRGFHIVRIPLPENVGSGYIINVLRKRGAVHANAFESVAHALCPTQKETPCRAIASEAEAHRVSLELKMKLNDELFRWAVDPGRYILFDMHNHPIESFAKRFVLGNKEGLPLIRFPRPHQLLTGPSGDADCGNLDDRDFIERPNIRHVSIVVDQGGFWLCTIPELYPGYNGPARARMLEERLLMVRASQKAEGKNLDRVIQRFMHKAAKIHPGMKIQFMPHNATDEEIMAAVEHLFRR